MANGLRQCRRGRRQTLISRWMQCIDDALQRHYCHFRSGLALTDEAQAIRAEIRCDPDAGHGPLPKKSCRRRLAKQNPDIGVAWIGLKPTQKAVDRGRATFDRLKEPAVADARRDDSPPAHAVRAGQA